MKLTSIVKCCAPLFLIGCLVVAPLKSAQADLSWENEFTNGQVVTNGTTVGIVTINTSIIETTAGDLSPGTNGDYFRVNHGTSGNHTGYFDMMIDNQNNDSADYLETTFTFSQTVNDLKFSLTDIDSNPQTVLLPLPHTELQFDDGVEVFYNGTINASLTPSLYTLGSNVILDGEPGFVGFESDDAAASTTQTRGNLDFDFTGAGVNSVTIRYRSTSQSISNPDEQAVGISDLTFTSPVPEPTGGLVLLLGSVLAIMRRKQA